MMQTVRVPLASNALYVSGTVNGIEKTWTREEGNYWSTTAETTEDGIYEVVLSIIYGDGKTTEDSITLYYGINLITDRTQLDVDTGTEKGYYNYIDLNRVESAVSMLSGLLASLPDEMKEYAKELGVGWDVFFDVPYDQETYSQMKTYVLWKESDFPVKSEMERYLSNVVLLRNALEYETSDLPSSMIKLSCTGANAIEKALEDLHPVIGEKREEIKDHLEKTAKSWYFSNEIYCGEVI